MGNQHGHEGGYTRSDADGNYYPGASHGGNQYPGVSAAASAPRSQTGGGGSVGGGSQSYASYSASSELEGGPNASRDERAAALEARLGKKRVKPKDLAAVKDAHWKRYNELERGSAADPAAARSPPQVISPQPGYRLGDSAPVYSNAAAAAASASAAAAAPSHVLVGQKRFESAQEAAVRAQRAAVYNKASEKKKESAAADKEARWAAYNSFEGGKSDNTVISNAPLPFGFPGGASGAGAEEASSSVSPASSVSPMPTYASAPGASASASSASPAPHIPADASPYFVQQMNYLLGKVRAMPPASVSLLRKIIGNVLKGGEEPSDDDMKYRRIKFNNPKIQAGLVQTDGAMELMLAIGFEPQRSAETGESMIVFAQRGPHSLDIAQLAFQELAMFERPSNS